MHTRNNAGYSIGYSGGYYSNQNHHQPSQSGYYSSQSNHQPSPIYNSNHGSQQISISQHRNGFFHQPSYRQQTEYLEYPTTCCQII